ncbi:MAG: C/D box methylation guide ribonucleoprotein complex aNOP56 subunit [Candidatus Njordarchaeia archaeon]|nr:C/D box methylation guide ribonucleoprotein complex aNOP56 subunit [Candidatus Korarchaeota archaeon]
MWLTITYPGILTFDDNFNLIKFLPFSKEELDPAKAAKILLALEKGQLIPELETSLRTLLFGLSETLFVDNLSLADLVSRLNISLRIKVITDNRKEIRELRNAVHEFINKTFTNRSQYVKFVNTVALEIAKYRIKEVGEKRDLMIIKAITISEDLTKMINTLISHVREWYSIYFPELDKLVEDHKTYLELVYQLGFIENFTEEALKDLRVDRNLISKILLAKEKTLGGKLAQEDIQIIQKIAKRALDLYTLKEETIRYLDALMTEVAPNIKAIIGTTIGAKLIRKAGGLSELAKMPASTIQILGAEKALFRALHGKGTPPKHGMIFQDPRIFKAPWWQRGKIARVLAAKLSLAARTDYYTGNNIADELTAEIDRRIREIQEKYPKPPIKKKEKHIKPSKKAKLRKKKRRRRN